MKSSASTSGSTRSREATRRRCLQRPSETASEVSPLYPSSQRVPCTYGASQYSTFAPNSGSASKQNFNFVPAFFKTSSPLQVTFSRWIPVSVVTLGLFAICLPFLIPRDISPVGARPVWLWDYNVYLNTNETFARRNLLISQTIGSTALEELAAVSSKPNRAYAATWRRDYVLYSSGSTSADSACLNKVHVLNSILDDNNLNRQLQARSRHPAYDVVALLPTDAIILDLDFDLDLLLPHEKLVALAGYNQGDTEIQSQTDVVLFNLKHPDATAVARQWLEATKGITCGASNDLQILVDVIRSIGDDSMIQGLEETNEGYIRRVIKCIFPSVPAPRYATLLSDIAESKQAMQTTADSVCYRYYPKCEVL